MGKAPPLRDNCFAMPRGVDWIPVQDALARLHDSLHPIVETETLKTKDALGRILSEDAMALADHPPFSNAAVDGYGFAFDGLPEGEEIALPLMDATAAAGIAFGGNVPSGSAIRILTGAKLPNGIDTIVLQEDVNVDAGFVHFRSGIKRGANTRPQGEDISIGKNLIPAGTKLQAESLGVLTSAGVKQVQCFKRLKVAVFATGDELSDAPDQAGQIPDANRPMLLNLISSLGHVAIDLGIIKDSAEDVCGALNKAAKAADAVITTGGASTGDEDHVSALLQAEGNMQSWRVAIKPGRPIAMAVWNGCPVFGLPGNPVAAFVCTLVFAAPAFGILSGQGWTAPQSFKVPAGFSKSKKDGREEYLRARIEGGRAMRFTSEGSGRISGLHWADGLIRLPHEAVEIKEGDFVDYLPFASWRG